LRRLSGEARTLRALGRESSYRSLDVRTPDGLRIAAQDWARPGSGRDVLLIHGYSQSHLSWLKQVSGPLVDEFRLVTYDLRGHGGSDKPLDAEFYGAAERWAGEVEAVIQAAELHQPVLVFWSYGGRIALDYLGCRGQRGISGLVFVCATARSGPGLAGPAAPLRAAMTQADLEGNIAATTAFLHACTARPLPRAEFDYVLAFNMVVPPEIRAQLIGRAADYEAILHAVTVPSLVMHGGEDAVNLPAVSDYIVANLPAARSIIYPGIGHTPFWENPQAFDRDLAEFLRSAPGPSA
jgi:non-heme chloroperoxidase